MTSLAKPLRILACAMVFGAVGCAETRHPSPGAAVRVSPPPPVARTVRPTPPACMRDRTFLQEGTASWYGRPYHGRRTASGQIYNMHNFTAAHRSLPFGSRIRVTNMRNGRSVLLTVNDRGPFVRGRIVDVSYRAARALNFVRAGLVPVRLERIGRCRTAQSAESRGGRSPAK